MLKTYYVLDRNGRILDAGGDWDQFALANGADGAVARKTIGTTLWENVAGFETQSYLNALFFAVRSLLDTISLPYRCDSPTERRLFNMTIAPADNLELPVDHALVSCSSNRQLPAVSSFTGRHSAVKCSVCCSFKVGKTWVDPFTSPDPIDFPEGLGVCPECKRTASQKIKWSKASQEAEVLFLRRA